MALLAEGEIKMRGTPDKKGSLERSRRRWENISIDVEEMGSVVLTGFICSAQGQVLGSSEFGDEGSVFIQCGDLLTS